VTTAPVLRSNQRLFSASVACPSWTARLLERSSFGTSPRFSCHSLTNALSSWPMMIRASEPPTKVRRSTLRGLSAWSDIDRISHLSDRYEKYHERRSKVNTKSINPAIKSCESACGMVSRGPLSCVGYFDSNDQTNRSQRWPNRRSVANRGADCKGSRESWGRVHRRERRWAGREAKKADQTEILKPGLLRPVHEDRRYCHQSRRKAAIG